MTYEEVLSDLKNLYGDGSTEFVMHPLRTETIRLAIEAVEKQIPKKPIYRRRPPNYVHTEDRDAWYCGCCGHRIEDIGGAVCQACGTAIGGEEG